MREKLIKLLNEAEEWADRKCDESECKTCQADKMKSNCVQQLMVDRLIANGVTLKDRDIHWATEQAYKNGYEKGKQDAVAKGNNVPSKWIPVTERLPEECKEVLAYRFTGCEVDSCVSHKKAYWSYDSVSDYPVTHWMPLPEPPKGE